MTAPEPLRLSRARQAFPSARRIALHSGYVDPHYDFVLVSVTPMRMPKVKSPVRWKPFLAVVFAILVMLPAAQALKGSPPGEHQMPRNVRHETKHEIDHLEDVWRQAVLSGNISAMDRLLADDYMAITPTGTLQSKDLALANLRGGKVHFTSIDLSDRKVRFYGTTALVTSRAEVSATGPDGDISGSYRYTRVYVKDAKGVWRIVSFEASRIREPDVHK